MTKFEIAYNITRQNEGGWHGGTGVNKADRGGETYKGIARKIHPTWPGWAILDNYKKLAGFPQNAYEDPKLNALVLVFYKELFWNKNKLGELQNQSIANELFDTGVNCGTHTAAIFLQKSLNFLNRNGRSWPNIGVDGKIGAVTLRTANSLSRVDQVHLFNSLNVFQGSRYLSIIERDPTQEEFYRGWLERVELMRV